MIDVEKSKIKAELERIYALNELLDPSSQKEMELFVFNKERIRALIARTELGSVPVSKPKLTLVQE